jgi:Universal stress protein family
MRDPDDPQILLFYDGSLQADIAVREAGELALAWGAHLTILTVAALSG